MKPNTIVEIKKSDEVSDLHTPTRQNIDIEAPMNNIYQNPHDEHVNSSNTLEDPRSRGYTEQLAAIQL